jgi:hypothetical protein
MEKDIVTSYHFGTDASSIYQDRASADMALQNTAADPSSLAEAIKNCLVILDQGVVPIRPVIVPGFDSNAARTMLDTSQV